MKSPKKPKKTAEEVALEKRQLLSLDDEIAAEEARLKALSRNKLGPVSLLAGAGRNAKQHATRGTSRSSGGASASSGSRSLIPSGGLANRTSLQKRR